MSRLQRVAACAAAFVVLSAPSALAHESSPKYQSFFNGIKPTVGGVQAQVLGFDNQYEVVNQTGKMVVIYGYNREPYARILPDGTVEVNQRSPALYLNEDRFGTTPVPASAKPKAAPLWKVQDKANRFAWHDHRMHWMAQGLPPQVKDQHKRTKIFNYTIPIAVNGQPANITGTLVWLGTPKGFPTGAIIALLVVAMAAVGFVVLVRRRRSQAAAGDAGSAPPTSAPDPTPSEEPKKEAW